MGMAHTRRRHAWVWVIGITFFFANLVTCPEVIASPIQNYISRMDITIHSSSIQNTSMWQGVNNLYKSLAGINNEDKPSEYPNIYVVIDKDVIDEGGYTDKSKEILLTDANTNIGPDGFGSDRCGANLVNLGNEFIVHILINDNIPREDIKYCIILYNGILFGIPVAVNIENDWRGTLDQHVQFLEQRESE